MFLPWLAGIRMCLRPGLLNRRECDSVLARPLGAGETREVPLRVRPSRRGIPATVIVGWPDGTYRDEAYFRPGLD
ncbi:hypothetical protein GCM10010280_54930 [Streptomyces pilosus]|uniref:Uncharacterized protein n=1 Tax=Streptomyces pilosus TaxID=28893 RepID=A0A918BZZ4_9ACTN|nr:hypothetical protein GCM10010280_54930 [Streptomyces pilosus]